MNTHDPDRFPGQRLRESPVAAAGRCCTARQPGLPSGRSSSSTLFPGEHEIGIEHHGALYRLKITRQGKLILNK